MFLVLAATLSVIEPLPGERWHGGTTFYGEDQPYNTTPARNLAVCSYCNPCAPFFVSTAGRYVWSDFPFTFAWTNGVLYITSEHGSVKPVAAGSSLKTAYLAACRRHFAPSGRRPESIFFEKPQFNTWVESCAVGNGQAFVEAYIRGIVDSRIPCGVLMIDDGWAPRRRYGDLEFNTRLFPDPRAMFAKCRAAGFRTILWTTPYINKDARFYVEAAGGGLLLANDTTGRPYDGMYYWGVPAAGILDVLDARVRDLLEVRYKAFASSFGFDGYKFDFTDAECILRKPDGSDPGRPRLGDATPADYTGAWGRFAMRFPFHEMRAGWKFGGLPLVCRLQDKRHSWEDLRKLVPDVQAAGLLGCPFVCPDMVGGGCGGKTFAAGRGFDRELFIRSCAAQAMMPMMQFSAAPWRLLDAEGLAICRGFAELHINFASYILELADHAAKTGEPIVRTMEYEFPGFGAGDCRQQFMLGDRWLVAPVVEPGGHVDVRLPEGRWLDDLGELHVGPKKLRLEDVHLGRLPRFMRQL